MNKNDIFEIEITGTTDEGDGVGRAEGMAVFVPYALLGEIVRVIIVKVLKNYAAGKLLEVTGEFSEDSVNAALKKVISAKRADMLETNLNAMQIGAEN